MRITEQTCSAPWSFPIAPAAFCCWPQERWAVEDLLQMSAERQRNNRQTELCTRLIYLFCVFSSWSVNTPQNESVPNNSVQKLLAEVNLSICKVLVLLYVWGRWDRQLSKKYPHEWSEKNGDNRNKTQVRHQWVKNEAVKSKKAGECLVFITVLLWLWCAKKINCPTL